MRLSSLLGTEVMTEDRSNIILIGMPGSGKSTVGVILARLTARDFVDTDVLIQTQQGRTLQDIVDRDGYLALRGIEENVILKLDCRDHVIATGGSAVYSPAAMAHVKSQGIAVFLHVDLRTLRSRVEDYDTRGLAKRPDQSLDDLFAERLALYREYADVTVNCIGLTHEEVCASIIEELQAGRRTGL
jgi:shikimate kinase